jgi:DNA-binding transcriptional LysR family regulator
MLELRELHRFAILAEEGHFGRAAARLGMGQPQLSRALQRLERAVGATLLARTSREVGLTEAGRSLLADAQRLLEIAEAAPHAARRAARGEAGRLALGFSGSCAYSFMPGAIEGFRRSHPQVELALSEMAADRLIEALREGRLDLVLVRRPGTPQGLAGALVFHEKLVAALPRVHPLAGRARIAPAALADSPFVMFPRDNGTDFHRQVAQICAAAGFTPRIAQEVSPMHALIGLVSAGVGVAIVPASVSKLRFAGVVYRLMVDITARSEVWALWRPETLPAPARAFARHLGIAEA